MSWSHTTPASSTQLPSTPKTYYQQPLNPQYADQSKFTPSSLHSQQPQSFDNSFSRSNGSHYPPMQPSFPSYPPHGAPVYRNPQPGSMSEHSYRAYPASVATTSSYDSGYGSSTVHSSAASHAGGYADSAVLQDGGRKIGNDDIIQVGQPVSHIFKEKLYAYCSQHKIGLSYVYKASGPDHQPTFNATVTVGDIGGPRFSAVGVSKKDAQAKAAQAAWLNMGLDDQAMVPTSLVPQPLHSVMPHPQAMPTNPPEYIPSHMRPPTQEYIPSHMKQHMPSSFTSQPYISGSQAIKPSQLQHTYNSRGGLTSSSTDLPDKRRVQDGSDPPPRRLNDPGGHDASDIASTYSKTSTINSFSTNSTASINSSASSRGLSFFDPAPQTASEVVSASLASAPSWQKAIANSTDSNTKYIEIHDSLKRYLASRPMHAPMTAKALLHNFLGAPVEITVDSSGADHMRMFTALLHLGDQLPDAYRQHESLFELPFIRHGSSKKEAEQNVATDAIVALRHCGCLDDNFRSLSTAASQSDGAAEGGKLVFEQGIIAYITNLQTALGPSLDLFESQQRQHHSKRPHVPSAYMARIHEAACMQATYRQQKIAAQHTHKEELKATVGPRIRETQARLPVTKYRDHIIHTLASKQVLVISAETGSGKSTQVAQMILDHSLDFPDDCKILVTQPRRISAVSLAARIAAERGEQVGLSVGYQVRHEECIPTNINHILLCSTGMLINYLHGDPNLRDITHVVLDEVHERSLDTDLALLLLRELLPRRPDLRLIVMSATLQVDRFHSYFRAFPSALVNIPGATFPVQSFFREGLVQLFPNLQKYQPDSYNDDGDGLHLSGLPDHDLEFIADLVAEIVDRSGADEGILVFLTGTADINYLTRVLTQHSRVREQLHVLPLSASMTLEEQSRVLEPSLPQKHKVVLATNVAEMSITIDDIVHVVDSGRVKEMSYRPDQDMSTLTIEYVSKSSAIQRRGRAGRVRNGLCYHIFTEAKFLAMNEHSIPEILRVSLADAIVKLKVLWPDQHVSHMLQQSLDPPSQFNVERTLKALIELGVITPDNDLTPLGRCLSRFPLEPKVGKMLVFAVLLGCAEHALTAAAFISIGKDIFDTSLYSRDSAAATRLEFGKRFQSDFLTVHAIYLHVHELEKRGVAAAKDYCAKSGLNYRVIHSLGLIRRQLEQSIAEFRAQYGPGARASEPSVIPGTELQTIGVLEGVLVAGLYPNIGKFEAGKKGRPGPLTTRGGRPLIHPSSTLYKSTTANQRAVFAVLVRTQQYYVRSVSVIGGLAALLFSASGMSANLVPLVPTSLASLHASTESPTDPCILSIGTEPWMRFQVERATGESIVVLRRLLQRTIQAVLTEGNQITNASSLFAFVNAFLNSAPR